MPHLALNNNCPLTSTDIDNFIELIPPPKKDKQKQKQNTKQNTTIMTFCSGVMLERCNTPITHVFIK